MAIDFSKFMTGSDTATRTGGIDFNKFLPAEDKPPEEKKFETISQKDFFQGGGYGYAQSTDPYTGKPLMMAPLTIPATYNTPERKISQISPQRLAVSFDPTKAQKLTPEIFPQMAGTDAFRLPDSASAPIKQKLGGTYSDELDHQIALELAGSNAPENLKVVPGRLGGTAKTQDTLENKLAKQVVNGDMSLVDAQLQLAQAKGFRLTESKPGFIEGIQNELLKSRPETVLQPLANLQTSAEDIKNIGGDISNLPKDAISPFIDAWNSVKSAVSEKVTNQAEYSKRGLDLISAGANLIFSPISAAFNALKDVPGLNIVPKLVSLPFQIAGTAGEIGAKELVDNLPLSEDTKNTIRESAGQVGSLAGQLAVGYGIGKLNAMRALHDTAMDVVDKKAAGETITLKQVQETLKTKIEAAKPESSQPAIPQSLQPPAEEARKYKSAEELFNKGTKEEKSNFIKSYFDANGLKVDKIVRAKLDDGFYVYHEGGMERRVPYRKLVKQEGNELTFEVGKKKGNSDFVADDSVDMLEMTVMEAKNRLGISNQKTIPLTDFFNQATGGVSELPKLDQATREEKIISPTALETKMFTQGGFINPGAMTDAARETYNTAHDYILRMNEMTRRSGNLDDDLFKVTSGMKKILDIEGKKLLKQADNEMTMDDVHAIDKWLDTREIEGIEESEITPEQKTKFDRFIRPLMEESQRMYKEITGKGIPVENELRGRREPLGRGGIWERLKEGTRSIGTGGALSKTAPALKHRVMKVLVGEKGTRQVASIKKGLVTAWTDKAGSVLGNLNLKTYEDLIIKETKPLSDRLSNLQKEMEILKSVKTREPVGSKLYNLEEKLNSALENLYGRSDYIPSREEDLNLRSIVRKTLHDISLLSKIPNAEKVILRTKRINNIMSEMVDIVNKQADIESRYNFNELDDKVFVDKNGKRWTITDGTKQEIEQHSNVIYSKDVLGNELINYNRLMQVQKAIRFLDDFKNDPSFNQIAVKYGSANIPKGWKPTEILQLKGYAFRPEIADVLNKYAKKLYSGGDPVFNMRSLNGFLTTAMFTNPAGSFIHSLNLTEHFIAWASRYALTNPSIYLSFPKEFFHAFKDVATQSPTYVKMIEEGANMLHPETIMSLADLLKNRAYEELKGNLPLTQEIARVWGMKVKDFLHIFGGQKSTWAKGMWFLNDIYSDVAIRIETGKFGKNMEDAIKDTGKHLPNYRIPARVLNSRAISELLTNRNYTMFGSYRYGMLRSYGEAMKEILGKTPPIEKVRATTMLATIGVMTFFIWPELDKILKYVTGNQKATFGRRGPSTILYGISQVLEGKEDFSQLIQSVFTPALGSEALAELAFNVDLFTRQKLYNQFSEVPGAVVRMAERQIEPISQAGQITSGKKSLSQFLWSILGVSMPKNTPSERNLQSMIYDERSRVLSQIKKLKEAKNYEEAQRLINDFNDRLLQNARDAAKENQKEMSDSELRNKLKSYFIKTTAGRRTTRGRGKISF